MRRINGQKTIKFGEKVIKIHHKRTSCTWVLCANENPLLPCQYRDDVMSERTGLYAGCTRKRRLQAICLAGVQATVKPINAITRERQIDGEHRPFRIIPALSVTKRESAGDFTQDPVGSAPVLFVSVPATRMLHILHLSPGTRPPFFFNPPPKFSRKKVPSMQLNLRWRGPWQRITDWMECFYAVRISQARARLPLRPAIKWKMNGREKTLAVVISLRREILCSRAFPIIGNRRFCRA